MSRANDPETAFPKLIIAEHGLSGKVIVAFTGISFPRFDRAVHETLCNHPRDVFFLEGHKSTYRNQISSCSCDNMISNYM